MTNLPGRDDFGEEQGAGPQLRRRGGRRRMLRISGVVVLLVGLVVASLRVINPPVNFYQFSEWRRLGRIEKNWVPLGTLPAHVPLSAAAAEDANFCVHWGFDVEAIRAALGETRRRGASTITQQTVKNVFLWPDRSWLRKGLEAGLAPLIELAWGKRRIMEVYLNVAEFDEGVFGIEAAARHHFGIPAAELGPERAARLMAVLPDPKGRSAVAPGQGLKRRAAQIAEGARALAVDGRGVCLIG